MSIQLNPEQIHDASQHNGHFADYKRNFASGEWCAGLAYDLPNSPLSPVLVLQPSGSWEPYSSYPLSSKIPGIHAFVLIPIDTQSTDVKIVFRGTYDSVSLLRSFEFNGPGAISFAIEKSHLLSQVDTLLQKHYTDSDSIELTVAGHSLGASDSEHFAAALCHEMATGDAFQNVTSLNLYSLNSPGISHKITEQSVTDVIALKDLNPDFSVHAHFGKSSSDPIQQLGENHFLHGIDSEYANIDLIEMDKTTAQEYETLKDASYWAQLCDYYSKVMNSHQLKTYFSPDDKGFLSHEYQNFTYLNNQCPDDSDALKAEFTDKAFITTQILKTTFYYGHSAYTWLNEYFSESPEEERTQQDRLSLKDVLSDCDYLIPETDFNSKFLASEDFIQDTPMIASPFLEDFLLHPSPLDGF